MLNLTFNKLQRMVQRYTKRDDIYDIARDLIRATEIKIAREVKPKGFEDLAVANMTIGDRWIDQPPLVEGVNSFDLFDGGVRYPVFNKRYDFITRYAPNAAVTGRPKYYCQMTDTKFIVAPTPDQAYQFEIFIYKQLDPLSDSNQTNWLTTRAPMLLVYGILVEASGLLENDPRLATWEKFFKRESGYVSSQSYLLNTDRASQQGVGPVASNDYDAATLAALLGGD